MLLGSVCNNFAIFSLDSLYGTTQSVQECANATIPIPGKQYVAEIWYS